MPTKPEVDRLSGPLSDTVLDIDDLAVHFQLQGGAFSRLFGLKARVVKAVDGVTVSLRRGEVLGLVGESGSGKSTFGRALLGLVPATDGRITYHSGRPRRAARLRDARGRAAPAAHRHPDGLPGPARRAQPLDDHRGGDRAPAGDPQDRLGQGRFACRWRRALERVGLSPVERFLSKYPSDLSGGQKQRAVIARAIILNPEVLVADEPVSMLDMSVRAKILQLMLDLKQELGLTYVYITHDLASAKYFCDRIAIMYLGRIVEIGPTEEIFANPRHPYTKALLKAIPEPDPDRMVPRDLPRGEIPDAAEPPLGCSFHPRCPEAIAECGWESRDLRVLLEEHWTRKVEAYDDEKAVIGDLDSLDQPSTTATIGKGGAGEVRALLDRIKAENPDEPLWTGVRDIEPAGNGVEVQFQPADSPALRRAGGVDVACVLYPAEPE